MLSTVLSALDLLTSRRRACYLYPMGNQGTGRLTQPGSHRHEQENRDPDPEPALQPHGPGLPWALTALLASYFQGGFCTCSHGKVNWGAVAKCSCKWMRRAAWTLSLNLLILCPVSRVQPVVLRSHHCLDPSPNPTQQPRLPRPAIYFTWGSNILPGCEHINESIASLKIKTTISFPSVIVGGFNSPYKNNSSITASHRGRESKVTRKGTPGLRASNHRCT